MAHSLCDFKPTHTFRHRRSASIKLHCLMTGKGTYKWLVHSRYAIMKRSGINTPRVRRPNHYITTIHISKHCFYYNNQIIQLTTSSDTCTPVIFLQPLTPIIPSQFWDHTPTVSSLTLVIWLNWTFTCCKTVEDPHCPVTVYWQSQFDVFAQFTCSRILHKIWKFCIKFGHLIFSKNL